MQVLTDAERDVLVRGGLTVEAAGLEVLNLDLTPNTDYGVDGVISDDLLTGAVARTMANTIHGTFRGSLSTELPWGNVLVRPYQELSNGIGTLRRNCGVYMLTSTETPVGEVPITRPVQGVDRLYLLNRDVGDDYTVTATTTLYDALVQVFADAGLTGVYIDGAAGDYTVPVDRDWPLVARSSDPDQTSSPVTWLRVVNDLQEMWNGRGVWADENGLYRCQQYQAPTDRPPEFTFDADDEELSIVGDGRTIVGDEWKTPNRWVFIWKNRPGGVSTTEGDGRYTVNLDDGDARSAASRGLVWAKVYEYDAASQDALEALGDRRVADDRRVVEQIKLTTGPFPVAGHYDVFTYNDTAAGGSRKVMATDWSFDLLGGDVSWTWETVE